jgi:trk system potassium uptake protein
MNLFNLNRETREKLYKNIFIAGDRLKILRNWIRDICGFIFVITVLLFLLSFIYYIGFSLSSSLSENLKSSFRLMLLILAVSKFLPEIMFPAFRPLLSFIFRVSVLIFSIVILSANFKVASGGSPVSAFFYGTEPVISAIFIIIISEISHFFELISKINIPASLIFSGSFFFIILIGSGLLMLPKAHTVQISFLDAIFTSVSAVCVTGLIVVDTATSFSLLGKIFILVLIQIGGLGIMTFTGFFSYIFTTRSSLHERMLLRDIFSSKSMGNLFKILTKIIIFTLLTELAGAFLIYSSLDENTTGRGFFSVFHAVSAFCNAGFSTLSEGLCTPSVNRNYTLLTLVSVLIILGGIGFPVLLRIYSYVKYLLILFLRKIRRKRPPVLKERLNLSSRIVLVTTVLLLAGGGILYYFLEKDNSMRMLQDSQKTFLSFFNSVTVRTAGFSMIDLTKLGYPAIFLTMFLMWVGASPGSTGGGIKTTTFAIAIRSAWSNIRGRNVLEISNRQISNDTVTRVLSIVILSMVFILAGFFSLLLTETGKDPIQLLFECFSAFGTVGLSLANTSTLSETGKIIIIILMFAGRVGPLTLLSGFFISNRKKYYQYPESDIIIN